MVFMDKKEPKMAFRLWRETMENAPNRKGLDDDWRITLQRLGAEIERARGNRKEAIALRRSQLAAMEKSENQKRQLPAVRAALGADLAADGQFAEADALLNGAWQEEKAADYFFFERQRTILENLVQLYTEWAKVEPGKAALVEKWKAELQTFDDDHARREQSSTPAAAN